MSPVTIHIDGRPFSVEAQGRNLLSVCLSLGFDLPYFCWHPALHSVGACRQCAVKLFRDEKDARGRIVMSCMTPVTDGMRLSVSDPEARAFRSSVIGWLMVNHPHDCPICDEGGECHLQDMTVMSGHVYRGYRFTKRTHKNQDLGPFINHEMNRCIQCYRCVRFYRDHAGGRDLEVLGWHDSVYFGRQSDGALESEFSGNLVEVCPTGVFTDKTLREHYTRKWDLQSAPSICQHCAVGCNTIPGERYGELRRIRSRYNHEVNGYFLCDRGRYGYQFVNASSRIREPLAGAAGSRTAVEPAAALSRAASLLSSGNVVGIGSPRASVEANFALRELVGPDRFYLGVSDAHYRLLALMVDVLRESPARSASGADAAGADAVLVLGEDVPNTAPILALHLRQAAANAPAAEAMQRLRIQRWEDAALREAIRDTRGPFFIAAMQGTRLDDVAEACHRASADGVAALGNAVAHRLDPAAPDGAGPDPGMAAAAGRIASALRGARRPLVVSGMGLGSAEVIRAAANVARALKSAGKDALLSLVFPEAGSLGAALLARGGLESAAAALGQTPAAVVAVETDILARAGQTARRAFAGVRIVAVDHTAGTTTEAADVVLPAATFAETTGTLINSEGRAQRFFSVFPPAHPVQESWRWLGELAAAAGRRPAPWRSLDELTAAAARALPALAGITDAAPGASFRLDGQKIPRLSHRETGRTAVVADREIHEPTPADDPDTPFSHTMDARVGSPPPALIPRYWAPGWNSDQAVNKFQIEVGGALRGGDPGVRLFEPSTAAGTYHAAGQAAAAPEGTLLLVPVSSVFGSEELSSLSPGIAQRSPRPHVALCQADAAAIGVQAGASVHVQPEGSDVVVFALEIRELPRGIAVVPRGLPGTAFLDLPVRARISGGAS
jgi:NADH-quinone oxidoreductase subunit G